MNYHALQWMDSDEEELTDEDTDLEETTKNTDVYGACIHIHIQRDPQATRRENTSTRLNSRKKPAVCNWISHQLYSSTSNQLGTSMMCLC
jgi:hypothetical protein